MIFYMIVKNLVLQMKPVTKNNQKIINVFKVKKTVKLQKLNKFVI